MNNTIVSYNIIDSLKEDAGFDLKSSENRIIEEGETVVIGTNISINIPKDHFIAICSRSGLAAKHSIVVLNAPGIIDSGYTGEIKVILHNHSKIPFKISVGMRIAQAILMKCKPFELVKTSTVKLSSRGSNGLGSSGLI